MSAPAWIVPDWPAPRGVHAFVTTRDIDLGPDGGGRERVLAHVPAKPRWMKQVHGAHVSRLDAEAGAITADAAVTSAPGTVAVVLVADCMPVMLCDDEGERVGIAHAGWRGMAAGVIENTVQALGAEPSRAMAWLGPAIGPRAFEVGEDVREAFLRVDSRSDAAFAPRGGGKYLADLYSLARQRLARAGVTRVHGGGFCTLSDAARFFSYRRGGDPGRMGAFIWRE
ncbi:MAG TPA: peptidoglycan editing factor PgeF [Usitatibacter sp.]|nr:peptidoglycan editing factor PgeF [Usitatibacter sp.]